jgi:hypothetical protein
MDSVKIGEVYPRERKLILLSDKRAYKDMEDVLPAIKRFARFVCGRHGRVAIRRGDQLSKRDIRNFGIIIALCVWGFKAEDIIHLVYHLRSSLSWEGRFVVVFEDRTEKERLIGLSLLGDSSGKFRFEEVGGHAALSLPLFFDDLVKTINEIEEMGLETWHSLLDLSVAGALPSKVRHVEKLIEEGASDKLVGLTRALLEEIRNIDWLILLEDPHKDMRLVGDLLRGYPLERSLTTEDCTSIVRQVRQILSKSMLETIR